jgi:hypothetical protein
MRTTSLGIYNSAFCPRCRYTRSVLFSESTAGISLNSINQLIFVMETRCVVLFVETESLNII